MAPSFRLVHWLNNIPFPRKINQESIKLERKYSRNLPRLCIVHGRESCKENILVVDIEALEEIDASEIHAKMLNAKEVILPQSGENCKFPVADRTVQTLWRRSGTANINIDTESTCLRIQSPRFS